MRQSGVLMHITSLPSRGGIGTLGKEAFAFVDFLKESGMSIWQMLPVGPTGYGESPYQSGSSHAGNPLLIDLDALVEEGLLDAYAPAQPADAEQVDFPAVRLEKEAALERCYQQSYEKCSDDVAAYVAAHPWVEDWALFAALKEHFGGVMWSQWPDRAIRMREPQAVANYREKLKGRVRYHIFVQWLFARQWEKLKRYADEKGIALFGDMPIYIAEDSADMWTRPDIFQLDSDRMPTRVAGVPPDYFSADGQRWGNPLYDWKKLKKQRYGWWVERLRGTLERFDLLRIDHFIGFANYFSIPAECPTARTGRWELGPGRSLFRRLKKELPQLRIVAEDLGEVSPRVRRLKKKCGFPGMAVLSFGFGGDEHNQHLPAQYEPNQVVYTGTHDNDTFLGWASGASEQERAMARRVLGADSDAELLPCAIRALMESRADLCILPMQDILGLGSEARMNTPGTIGGNWMWRMKPGAADAATAARLLQLNRQFARGTQL